MLETFDVFTPFDHFHKVLVRLGVQIFPVFLRNQVLFVSQPTIEFAVKIMRVTYEVNGRL